jgi:hypothetical protein
MINLNLMFEHFVCCAGLTIFALFIGLIGVCFMFALLISGAAAATWIEPLLSDGMADSGAGEDRAANVVFVIPVF